MVLFDGEIQRPPVIDYKLVDVPDLGYFATDRPYPRGELLLKTENMFPGYYKRPETTADVFDADGYYRTGDVVAEVAPDRLVYVDRRNNVLKLAQGEFVTAREAGGGVRQQPAGPPDLRLRQQRTALPAGGRGAHRRGAGTLRPRRRSSRRSPSRCRTSPRQAGLQSYEVPRDFIIETTPFTPGERSADRHPQAGVAEAQAALRRAAGTALRRPGRRPGQRAARTAPQRRRRAGAADREPGRGRHAGHAPTTDLHPMRTSPTWAETRCPR